MANATPISSFEFIDPGGPLVGDDIVGLWTSKSVSRAGRLGLSFSTGSTVRDGDAFSWRTSLPGDRLLATRAITEAETKVESYVNSLALTGSYIDRLATGDKRSWEEMSRLGIAANELGELMKLRSQARLAGVDFGLVKDISTSVAKLLPQFEEFVNRIQRLITQYANVETLIGDQLIARTVVTWAGDNHTLWMRDAGDTDASLHQRSLALSLKSKDAWVQTFVLIAQSTLKLSILFASGAGILALPASWKIVNDLLAQAATLQMIRSEKP